MSGSKALFLDRDGVINIERGYVHLREEFQFQDGIFELCRSAQEQGYLLFVVTNQAGIARGFYTEAEFLDLTQWMIDQFARELVRITQTYYCPYHPVHGVGVYKHDSPDRKPNPGLLFRAKVEYDLDFNSSILIGDKLSDIEAAKAAGINTRILLETGTDEHPGYTAEYFVSKSLHDIRDRFFSEQ